MAESVDALDLKSNRGSPSVPVQVWPGAIIKDLPQKGKSFCYISKHKAKILFRSFIQIMGLYKLLEKNLTKFGENNTPAVVSMGIAAAKGIFRPIFTMSDKKQDYETRRYAAWREGLTEAIAIPIYFLSGVVSKVVAKKLARPEYFMKKDILEKSRAGDKSPEVLNAVKQAEILAKENLPKIQTTIGFAGVCISALFLIPLICSLTIKPIMKKLERNKPLTDKQGSTQPLTKNTSLNNQQTFRRNMLTKQSIYGPGVYNPMKVGGV